MTSYTVIRYVWDVPIAIERVIVFPMAAVPNAWGLWNVLYRAFFGRPARFSGCVRRGAPAAAGPGRLRRRAAARFHDTSRSVRSGSLWVARGPDYLLSRVEYFVGFLNAELGIA